ncbi:MAG: energy-coupled thiamine transporter ThiT [Oscillospiraceae bacterium]|jgi:thiamine transporter|nr:energy-coupled thiamine transporter ThiT [Oscillospiraceae bacterium]
MLKESKNKIITEMSISAALAFVLHLFIIIKMPSGGSATLGDLPIIIFSFRHGAKLGILLGAIYGLTKIFFGFHMPPVINLVFLILIFLLDYIIANMCLGLSSIFSEKNEKKLSKILLGISLSYLLKFICHVISGFTIWKTVFSSQTLIFVAAYNLAYILPEMFVICVIYSLIFKTEIFKNKK